jgi:glutamate carboxypeptidase
LTDPVAGERAPLPALAVEEAQRVAAGVSGELDLLLSDLQTWVNVDTPSGAVEELDQLAAMLAHTVESYGLHPELVPVRGVGLYLHATLEGAGRARVALLCHHDTVFPLGTAADRPFSHDSQRVYGPGVADMKGGVAVAVHAARHLAQGPRPFARLELICASDEEARTGAPLTMERLAGFDAVLCMECGRVDGSIVSARKGGRWFRIHAEGRPAHAGVDPDGGRNAVLALCREAVRLSELHHAREGLTFQVTELYGGEGVNTVPGRAYLTGDMRAPTAEDLVWAVEQVQAYEAHDDIELRWEDLGGPPPLERTAPIAALAGAAIELGAGLGHRFTESSTGGVSDGSWTAWSGIPTLDGLGPVGGDDHTPFEYAELDTFATRAGVVAGLAAAIDAGLLDRTASS